MAFVVKGIISNLRGLTFIAHNEGLTLFDIGDCTCLRCGFFLVMYDIGLIFNTQKISLSDYEIKS